MAWIKLDDRCSEHPKIVRVGPLGLALWVSGLGYCNRNVTDGFIPTGVAHRLIDWPDADVIVTSLVRAEVWHEVDGGYQVHDYLDYQPSRDQLRGEQERRNERQARFRERKRNADSNDASNGGVTEVSQGPRTRTRTPGGDTPPDPPAGASGFKAALKAGRDPDPLWDALVAALDLDASGITKARRGKLNAALKELREVGATPDEITRRAKRYRREHPDWAFTETALANHWAALAPAKKRPAVVEDEPDVETVPPPPDLLRRLAGGTPTKKERAA